MSIKTINQSAVSVTYVDMGDGTYAERIVVVNPDGSSIAESMSQTADRELLPTRYTCKQAFTGAVIGDVIRQTVALDVSGAVMTVVSVLWENESSSSVISAPPSVAAYLTPLMQGDALSLAQLLSAGLATATNQVTQIGYLADLADANDRFGNYKLVQSEDLGAGTKYILKSDGVGWLMIRKTYSDTASSMAYAGPANNAGVTLAQAWGQRGALTFGAISAA